MKKLIGLMLAMVVASLVMALPAMAAHNATNTGGVVIEKGSASDCNGGSCGGVIVEDPAGTGPDCIGGNCGGSVCQGTDCGQCDGGNCGGSISGPGTPAKGDAPKALPRTGNTLPLAATVALGAGMLLVGAFFTFVANPSTKVAMAALTYRPKRRV